MRELKFRVWNGMEIIYDVMVGKFGAVYVNPGDKADGLDPNDSASLTPFNTRYSDTVPVMQFTGLKDINGKEIWEGDIITAYNAEQTGIDDEGGEIMANVTGKVIYEDGAFHYDGHSAGLIPLSYNIEDIEVIGNIYENPELLNTPT